MQRQKIFFTNLAALAVGGVLLSTALRAADNLQSSPPVPSGAAVVQPGHNLRHLTPIEYFRGLLAMNPGEREHELARKSPADRAIIMAKLQEYQAMPREIREARLCQTELQWELLSLLKLPIAERTAKLKEVSPLYMPMFTGLLNEWDQVPAATQKALLENESFISVYLRMQGNSPRMQRAIFEAAVPPGRRGEWAKEMERWQALPESQRTELCAQFQHFCQLSAPAREETVHALSDAERKEMEEALKEFDQMPANQRQICMNSFRKFATMAPAERAEFLKNAARWDSMTQDERRLWRELVHTLPPMPPMPETLLRNLPPPPPGFPNGLPPMPPMPPNVTTPVVIAREPRT